MFAETPFHAWLKQRRKLLDLTQQELAERVGCAIETIRKLERGQRRPSKEIAQRLTTHLHVPPEEHATFIHWARTQHVPDAAALSEVRASHQDVLATRRMLTLRDSALTHRWRNLNTEDAVPDPASLPPGSRMPLSHNSLFIGRSDELRELARVLKADAMTAICPIAAVTGLGGIGKTQLAAEFVHRYGQFFVGGVFWLSFADPAAVSAVIAACGDLDGMRLSLIFNTLPLDDQVRLVLAEWHSSLPRLLVFDNCEDETLLNQWRPKHGGCRVLVTSRRHHWDPALGVQPVPLTVLPRSDSLRLLRQFRPDLSAADPDLAAIAKMLGDLPLALHLAGSFLKRYQQDMTTGAYVDELYATADSTHESLEGAGISPTQHDLSVARTFQLSYERLDSTTSVDTLALQLLTRAAYFAPGIPIARSLLTMTLQQSALDTRKMTRALRRLVNVGLLEETADGAFRLHRLVATFVRSISRDIGARGAVEESVLTYVHHLNQMRDPRPVLAIQAHLYFITQVAPQDENDRIIRLRNELGHHLWMVGEYRGAQACCEETVHMSERVLGTEHPITATSWQQLGIVLGSMGDIPGAWRCFARSLAIRERVLGAEHLDTAESLMGLGGVRCAQGRYEEARTYWEQNLTIRERVLGADHPDTVRVLINIGVLLDAQGQYSEARMYLERSLAIQEQSVGPDHQDTALSLLSLGEVLYEQKEYGMARTCFERALAIQRKVLGVEHPDTGYTLVGLGLVLDVQDNVPQARQFYEQALAIFEVRLGPDHRYTHIVRNNLLALDTQPHTTMPDTSRRVPRRQRLR